MHLADPAKPPLSFCCDAAVIHPLSVFLPVRPAAGAVLRVRGPEASSSRQGGRGRSGVRSQRGRRERVQEVQQPLPGR